MSTTVQTRVPAAAAPKGSRLMNVVSVDVEDYFHAETFAGIVQRSEWDSYASRVEDNTRRLLDLFARLNVEATFFVLGWVAERFPKLVRDIASTGHEVACHSYWHRLIYKLDPAEFRSDTYRAKQVIEQAAGVQIYGYRAPTYSIVMSSLWATGILAELGFTYDSSIFPSHHDRYGIPSAPRFPFVINTTSGPVIEYPIATFRLWGNQLGWRRAEAEGIPAVAYIHPWEIDTQQPRLKARLKARLRHYTNLGKASGRLEKMLGRGNFTSFRNSGLAAMAPTVDLNSWGKNGSR